MVFHGVIGAEIRAYLRFIMENDGAKKQDMVKKYNISRALLYRILNNENCCLKRMCAEQIFSAADVLENLMNPRSSRYREKLMPFEDKRVPLPSRG